jgi:hypothetical protein
VGSRLKAALPALTLALALIASSAPAEAASKSPTPKATAKATATAKPSAKATATAKPSAKATATAKPSATAKATTTSTAKPTPKPTPTKKKIIKKKVRVTPSPKPSWPPKGFSVEGEVYAKVPTAKELVSLISANTYLEKQIKECTKFICGAVQVAAENGCIWWQVVASVSDGQGVKLGEMTKSFAGSTAREFKTLLLISPEPLEKGGAAKITSVICNHVDRDPTVAGSSYTKISG